MTAVPPSMLAWSILYASVALSVAFFVYGLNTLYLTVRAKRYKPPPQLSLVGRPSVAIHLPIYNEMYVVNRLLEACTRVALRYGSDRVRICIIDDSTDETASEIDRFVSDHSGQGLKFNVIRRASRQGFKAGALQAALGATDEKYIAVLDADFVPPDDFLDRMVPTIEQSPEVGFVQARWGHIDRNHNIITKSLAIGVDGHFLLEQQARSGNGYLMNFNGSAGVLRTEAIRKAGGWASDTLAEDLDLSYRMQLAGYRGAYLSDVEVPGELPPTIASVKRQQGRWARGSLQTARKLANEIRISGRLSIRQKVEAGIHLTYYLVHPLMVASFLLAVAADFLSINVIDYGIRISLPLSGGSQSGGGPGSTILIAPWLVLGALVVLSTLAVLFFCIQAVRAQNLGLVENAKQIILLVVLGYGISLSNSVHALGGLLSPTTGTFARTPKYAIESQAHTWKGKRYQIHPGKTALLEAGAVALCLAAIANAYFTGNFGILPIVAVYLLGYSFVLYLTLRQNLGSSRAKESET